MERQILFSMPMVKALIEGRKTQTRRVIFPQPSQPDYDGIVGSQGYHRWRNDYEYDRWVDRLCPYGVPGDTLWVREPFLLRDAGKWVIYRQQYEADFGAAEAVKFGAKYDGWKPSIYMPRWASRITLTITDVVAEKVQDIRLDDCLAEGVTTRMAYEELWNSINAERGFGWDENPFVWVIKFSTRVESK